MRPIFEPRVSRRRRRLGLPQRPFVVRVVQYLKVVHGRRIRRLGWCWQMMVNVRWQRVVVPLGQDGKLPMGGHQFGYFRRDFVIGTRRVQRQKADHRPAEVFELDERKHITILYTFLRPRDII